MSPEAVSTTYYPPPQSVAGLTHPATAPDTSPTQAPNSGEHSSLKTQSVSPHQPMRVQVYFFDPNLGQFVNILV